MLSKLQHLFLPHHSNNQKAKTLHLSSLFFLTFAIVCFQSSLSLLLRFKPGVLGYASDIVAQKLLELTNKERKEYGLEPLEYNDSLAEAAQQKASTMFTFDCWSHNCQSKTPWWFIENVGYRYLYAGENLARDFGNSQSVIEAWMESPTHRDNILNSKYQEIGFAVVDGVLDGEETTLVVQMFGTQGGAPMVAGGEAAKAAIMPEIALLGSEIVTRQPIISSFMLTKAFSLVLIVLLIFTLSLDTALIYRRNIVRISGKSFVHLSFFIIILISILLSYQGRIL